MSADATADLMAPSFGVDREPARLADLVAPAPAWFAHGACRGQDPALWHPDDELGRGRYREAVSICMVCPVRVQCLDHALAEREDVGVWGGRTPDQRRAERKRRQREALAAAK